MEPNFLIINSTCYSADYLSEKYQQFFDFTNDTNVKKYAEGRSLTALVDAADLASYVLSHGNPIYDTWNVPEEGKEKFILARQWQLDNLSIIKEKLAKAIHYKRNYYENDFFGKIKKFFLKLFGRWNDGNTSAIRTAEDWLLSYDLRLPLMKAKNGEYKERYFWPLISATWIQENLNTQNFYNYTPKRIIKIGSMFDKSIDLPRNFQKPLVMTAQMLATKRKAQQQ